MAKSSAGMVKIKINNKLVSLDKLARLRSIMLIKIAENLKQINEKMRKDLIQFVAERHRPIIRPPKNNTDLKDLSEAYAQATQKFDLDMSNINRIGLNMVHIPTLDTLTYRPHMNESRWGGTGYWRIYESGSPMVNMTSRHYRFVKADGYGMHGEGFMKRTNKPVDYQFGVRPIRAIVRMATELPLHVRAGIKKAMQEVLKEITL